jgi:hypothetical protein
MVVASFGDWETELPDHRVYFAHFQAPDLASLVAAAQNIDTGAFSIGYLDNRSGQNDWDTYGSGGFVLHNETEILIVDWYHMFSVYLTDDARSPDAIWSWGLVVHPTLSGGIEFVNVTVPEEDADDDDDDDDDEELDESTIALEYMGTWITEFLQSYGGYAAIGGIFSIIGTKILQERRKTQDAIEAVKKGLPDTDRLSRRLRRKLR